MSDHEFPALLTCRETAQKIGIAVETLARWRAQKRGPAFIRDGRFVRYRADDVAAYLTAEK